MKIIIDNPNEADIIVEEYLEPTSTCYGIKCEDKEIFLNHYQAEELIRTLEFLTRKYD